LTATAKRTGYGSASQNSILMAQLMKPEILVDIQMNRYGSFDFDKSEKLIAIGRQKTLQAIQKFQSE
jgi:NTE family protein